MIDKIEINLYIIIVHSLNTPKLFLIIFLILDIRYTTISSYIPPFIPIDKYHIDHFDHQIPANLTGSEIPFISIVASCCQLAWSCLAELMISYDVIHYHHIPIVEEWKPMICYIKALSKPFSRIMRM